MTLDRWLQSTFKTIPQEVDKMKKTTTVIAAIVLMSLSLGSAPQEGLQLFQKALAMERGEGNLEGAIALYQRIVRETQAEDLAAKAQLRIGICYEKLGKSEAQKAYQLVIEKYPAQTAQVTAAKARLVELTATAAKPPMPELAHLYSWHKMMATIWKINHYPRTGASFWELTSHLDRMSLTKTYPPGSWNMSQNLTGKVRDMAGRIM